MLERLAGRSYLKVSGIAPEGKPDLEPKGTMLKSSPDWRPTPPSVGFG